jgi:hypothetical protein
MNSDSYHKARNVALKDLAQAVSEAKLLEQRIARLKQTIASLDSLIEGEEAASEWKQSEQVGITDACRQALKVANGPRTAIEIRDWLASSGYELSEQENALASIHTVLKRLVKAQEAAAGKNKEGKATYEWVGNRSDSLTTAIQQVNYEAAKSVSADLTRMLAGATVETTKAVQRVLAQNAAQAATLQRLQEIDSRIRKTVESAKKKD